MGVELKRRALPRVPCSGCGYVEVKMDRSCSTITSACTQNTIACFLGCTCCCPFVVHDYNTRNVHDEFFPDLREMVTECIPSCAVFWCYCCDECEIRRKEARLDELRKRAQQAEESRDAKSLGSLGIV